MHYLFFPICFQNPLFPLLKLMLYLFPNLIFKVHLFFIRINALFLFPNVFKIHFFCYWNWCIISVSQCFQNLLFLLLKLMHYLFFPMFSKPTFSVIEIDALSLFPNVFKIHFFCYWNWCIISFSQCFQNPLFLLLKLMHYLFFPMFSESTFSVIEIDALSLFPNVFKIHFFSY